MKREFYGAVTHLGMSIDAGKTIAALQNIYFNTQLEQEETLEEQAAYLSSVREIKWGDVLSVIGIDESEYDKPSFSMK